MGDLSKHFSRHEFECSCGCGLDTVDYESILVLEDLREYFGRPVRINSASRCFEYNRSVGSNDKSQHPRNRAQDVTIDDISPDAVYEYLHNKYWNKYGIGRYDTFTHIDTRSEKARWDKRT